MEKIKKINWEEEFNLWLCSNDELLSGLSVTSTANSNGLIISIDEATYKISKPDSNFLTFY